MLGKPHHSQVVCMQVLYIQIKLASLETSEILSTNFQRFDCWDCLGNQCEL